MSHVNITLARTVERASKTTLHVKKVACVVQDIQENIVKKVRQSINQ